MGIASMQQRTSVSTPSESTLNTILRGQSGFPLNGTHLLDSRGKVSLQREYAPDEKKQLKALTLLLSRSLMAVWATWY